MAGHSGGARALITNAWCPASPYMPAILCPLRTTLASRIIVNIIHCTELASARATSLQGRLVWLGLLLLPNDTCAFSLISHGSAQAGPAPRHTLPQGPYIPTPTHPDPARKEGRR